MQCTTQSAGVCFRKKACCSAASVLVAHADGQAHKTLTGGRSKKQKASILQERTPVRTCSGNDREGRGGLRMLEPYMNVECAETLALI